MIKLYHDFVLRLAADGRQLAIDINGWPIDINLPQPIKIKLKSHLPRQGNLANIPTQDIAQLGHSLYDLIFVKEVGEQFQAYLNQRKNDVGIRVCINIQSGELSDTIWEVLCDRLMPSPNFLSLDPRTPVVRSLRTGKQLDDLEMRIPLKLLVLISTPRHMEPIDRKVEKVMLEQALAQVKAKRRITVDYLGFENPMEADFGRLQEYLAGQDTPYDIVHIIGHGLLESGEEGRVALVEPQGGKMQDVRASSLANIFRSREVKLIILQSCQSGAVDPSALYFSSAAQQLVALGVPAVLAMQEKIDQDVARYFIEKLYTQWLNSRCPFEDALTQARHDIYQRFPERIYSWAIPVLYIRPGAYLVPSWQTQSIDTTERQIDAALPQQTRVGKETELVTLIRKPSARGLREILIDQPQEFEVTDEDVKTSPSFDIFFPVDEKTGKTLPKDISIVIESNDFDPPRTEERIQLRPQVDSVRYTFPLTPKQKGIGRLLVRVVDIDMVGKPVTLTQLRLRTEVRGGKAFKTRYGVVSSSKEEQRELKEAIRRKGSPKTESKVDSIPLDSPGRLIIEPREDVKEPSPLSQKQLTKPSPPTTPATSGKSEELLSQLERIKSDLLSERKKVLQVMPSQLYPSEINYLEETVLQAIELVQDWEFIMNKSLRPHERLHIDFASLVEALYKVKIQLEVIGHLSSSMNRRRDDEIRQLNLLLRRLVSLLETCALEISGIISKIERMS